VPLVGNLSEQGEALHTQHSRPPVFAPVPRHFPEITKGVADGPLVSEVARECQRILKEPRRALVVALLEFLGT
jgi:hypothetical protein